MTPRNQIEVVEYRCRYRGARAADQGQQSHAPAGVSRKPGQHHRPAARTQGAQPGQPTTVRAESLMQVMRPPYFIPMGTPLLAQLQNFQEEEERLGLVVDEYGELMGLITLEDILEEIIGEFTTHSPMQSGGINRQADGSVLVEGVITVAGVESQARHTFSAGWAEDAEWSDSGAPGGHSGARHHGQDRRPSDRDRPDAGSCGALGPHLSRESTKLINSLCFTSSGLGALFFK